MAPLFGTIRPFARPECGRSRLVGNKRHRVAMILVLVTGGGGERPMPISRKRCRPRGLTRSIRIVIGAAISGRLPPEPEAIARQKVEPPDPVDTSIRGMPYRHVDAALHVWHVSSSRCEPV